MVNYPSIGIRTIAIMITSYIVFKRCKIRRERFNLGLIIGSSMW
jgi:hypothetical protein